jgi:hypothetical protein
MYKSLALRLLVFALIIHVIGCSDKKDDKTSKNTQDSIIASLITKDQATGKDKVQLKYIVNKGDKFSYKMIAKTSTSEKSPATEDKEVKQDNEINYFYSKEVDNVESSGIITYKVAYDSITIVSQMGDQIVKYDSNVNDSVKTNPAFLQYNAVLHEPFYIRVSPTGEITDVYGLEKIHENLFKAFGDTLKEEDKAQIKESFGKESIKEVLQQEYQMFPSQPVNVDSTWIKSYNTQILFFDVVNSAQYRLKGIEDKDGRKIANIEANLVVEFLNKEVKERGIKFNIEKSETSGRGKITFDLGRGCISNKETTTTLNLEMRMSAQGESAKSEQKVLTSLTITLLN